MLSYDRRSAFVLCWAAAIWAPGVGRPAHRLQAQVAWTQVTPVYSPPARSAHAMACDAARGRVVLFGGGAPVLADTWEWAGGAWTWLHPANNPSARSGHAMSYDAARGRVVLFGGSDTNGYCGDTWEWDGGNWTRRATTGPPARSYHALAYAAARGRVVLFGGGTDIMSPPMSDTWEWDGSNWTQQSPATSPPARVHHVMAYDAARARVVLFGGGVIAVVFRDTWEWDGSNWTQRNPAHSPPARLNSALAFDAARRRLVLFGGRTTWGTGAVADTWEWDGGDWTTRTTAAAPVPRWCHALAYDAARGEMVLFGGFDFPLPRYGDTWTYAPTFPAAFTAFGNGCAGSVGVPALAPVGPGDLPWLGTTFGLALGNLPAVGPEFLGLGHSRAMWGTTPLPLDLGGLGMPGCTLDVEPFTVLLMHRVGNTSTLSLSIGTDPWLLGAEFYAQGAAIDPAANAAGATMSNAGALRLGGL